MKFLKYRIVIIHSNILNIIFKIIKNKSINTYFKSQMYLVNIGSNIFDILTFIYKENKYSPREHNSVGRDIAYNIQ
jgi:hypothetical protein